MKQISLSLFFGVVLALAFIAVLQPLNSGAVGLVIFLCVGGTTAAGSLFRRRGKSDTEK
jgi:hypothetical protein